MLNPRQRGRLLRALICARGLTPRQSADKIGMPEETLLHLLRGRRGVSPTLWEQLMGSLGIQLPYHSTPYEIGMAIHSALEQDLRAPSKKCPTIP